jgi:hypothetical protein
VLLCAEEVSSTLDDLMTKLHARDVDFDYVAGVDMDSRVALEALARHQEDALYAICQDEHLDDYSASHLRETLLRKCKLNSQQVLTLPLRTDEVATQARALARRAELLTL